ncbi:MAG: glycosyltransferase family 2 protein, partial [Caldilineaceae bacterium]|nr:glycosyltransferase family 2 protein [Caldilineaceae bacterium]
VARIHAQNTSPKRVSGSRWHTYPSENIHALLAAWQGDGAQVPLPTPPNTTNGDPAAVPTQATPAAHRAIQVGNSPAPRDAAETDGATTPASAPPSVIVSLPYFRAKPYIARAVESILAQSYPHLTVVVVNDGDEEPPWPALAHLADPRLVRFDLAANQGRYFADAVVLAAGDAPYLLIQDADDWSEPARIATLLRRLRETHAEVISSATRLHNEKTRQAQTLRYPGLAQPLTAQFKHRADHHCLFTTAALRRIGGNYGGFRIGYDTLLINFLLMSSRVSYLDQPLYHRYVRPNSLTHSRQTGFQSAARKRVTQLLKQHYAQIYPLYLRYLSGTVTHDALCAAIRQCVEQQIAPATRAALQEEAARLRRLLPGAPHCAAPTAQQVVPVETVRPATQPAVTVQPVL